MSSAVGSSNQSLALSRNKNRKRKRKTRTVQIAVVQPQKPSSVICFSLTKTVILRHVLRNLPSLRSSRGYMFLVSFPSVMVVGPTDRRSVKTHCRKTTITSGAFGTANLLCLIGKLATLAHRRG